MNAISQNICNLCILQFSQHLSDLSNKIFRNKVWFTLDVSVNYFSSIQTAFRGLHDILQGSELQTNKERNWDFGGRGGSSVKLNLTPKCRYS